MSDRRSRIALSISVRLLVWALLFWLLYLLRSFFLLVFLTFVFAYIQTGAVAKIERFIKRRAIRVVLVGVTFLALVVGVFSYLLPSVAEQAKVFASSYTTYLRAIDKAAADLAHKYPVFSSLAPEFASLTDAQLGAGWHYDHSPSANMLRQVLGFGDGDVQGDTLRQTVETVRNVGSQLLGVTSAFLLSLIFSFLIVLDLPRLIDGVRSLKETKLGFMYRIVSPSIYRFGTVLGEAMEAQFAIAILNTILTVSGLWLLGFDAKLAFVSMIVFLCSFIPVAGVFISSVPICLVALQTSGLTMMLFCILIIIVVHQIEAYILNPRIYGHRLRLNPVLVLIVLTISGKLLGVWGLVLGLPIVTYIFRYAIRYDLGSDLPEAEEETAA